MTMKKSELVKLFQGYMDEAQNLLETDGFLPGLDVTEEATVDLLNDIILYSVNCEGLENDTNKEVTK